MRVALFALVVFFYLLHQDFWFWRSMHPLLFGLLPPGLWYHALYTIAASLLMALLVKLAWPTHLDHEDNRE